MVFRGLLDSDLYYLDAHMTMYTSAFPQVVYTIDVIEISELEGFEPYKFKNRRQDLHGGYRIFRMGEKMAAHIKKKLLFQK